LTVFMSQAEAAAPAQPTPEQMLAALKAAQLAAAQEIPINPPGGLVSAETRGFENFLTSFPALPVDNVPIFRAASKGFRFLAAQLPVGTVTRVAKDLSEHTGGVRGQWFEYPGADTNFGATTLIYFHGGAYIAGGVMPGDEYEGYVGWLAKVSGLRTLATGYDRPPDVPLATAVDQCVATVRFVVDVCKVPPHLIGIAGDSAGGGMSVLVQQRLLAAKNPIRVGAIVLYSPWVDVSTTYSTFATHTWDAFIGKIPRDVYDNMVRHVTQGGDAADPQFSPVNGNLNGFPPTRINVVRGERISGPIRLLHERLRAAGCAVRMDDVAGRCHCINVFPEHSPEAIEILARTLSWLKDQLA